jgi:hypothetical protein
MECKNQKLKEEEICTSDSRFLDWESGLIRSIEDALEACDKVETCNLKCECSLRDAYYFYLNQQKKQEKEYN